MIDLGQYRNLYAPGLREKQGQYSAHWGPVEADIEVIRLPNPGLRLKSYLPNTDQYLESFIPAEALLDGGHRAYLKSCAVIFPLFIFADEAVVGYDC